MASFSFYKERQDFATRKNKELIRIDEKIKESIAYQLSTGRDFDAKSAAVNKVFEFANIFNTNINIYEPQGKLISGNLKHNDLLESQIITNLKNRNKILIKDTVLSDGKHILYQSFSFIKQGNTPVAILNIESIENKDAANAQIKVLVKQYLLIFIFLILLSAIAAWLISKNLTKKINDVSQKISEINLGSTDTKLVYPDNDEIKPLVKSYNQLQTKIKEQTFLLQKNERAEAWKEMARQVAHEINNPLTPLRLTIQNFQRKYQNNDPDNPQKVKNLTQTVVHQIDIIAAITKSFSDYAKMPVNNDSVIDVVETIRRSLEIFPPEIVVFSTNSKNLYYKIDELYLTRIITNIVKNGIQAIPNENLKKIEVNLNEENNRFLISVADNGTGISEEDKPKIFEPNFTTKSEGMGLGLSMVKKIVEDYNGKIWFETQQDFGTVFFIEFLKHK